MDVDNYGKNSNMTDKVVHEIIAELKATSSRNEKEEILQGYKDNSTLKECFRLAYCPSVTFGIKSITSANFYGNGPDVSNANLATFLLFLDNDLSTRVLTGNAALAKACLLFEYIPDENFYVAIGVLQKDLDCGVSGKTVNKIWPGLVMDTEVMLVSKDEPKVLSKIPMPAICQKKMDGARINITLKSGIMIAMTRNGKSFEIEGEMPLYDDLMHIFKEIKRPPGMDTVTLDGEILYLKKGKVSERTSGNGIVNKAIKGTISYEEKDNLAVCLWDVIYTRSAKSVHVVSVTNIPYEKRFGALMDVIKDTDWTFSHVTVVDTEWVESVEEAQELASEWMAEGHEGAILKDPAGIWEPKRVKHQVKLKGVEEADLRVIEWIEGTGKYKGMLGALRCATECGGLEVNIGTGFSDAQRASIDKKVVDSVVAVKYNTVISKKDSALKSLFLPRFVEIRFDKDEANTLKELK